MMAMLRHVLPGLCGTILWLMPALCEATIVFDFEDEFQGWVLFQAGRQDTGELGGEYVIGGADGSSMSIEIDLTDYHRLTFDRLYRGEDPRYFEFAFVTLTALEGPPFLELLGHGESLLSDDQSANPDTRAFDISAFVGLYRVRMLWDALLCVPPEYLCFNTNFSGAVDNVTFFSVPEPRAAVHVGTIALSLMLLWTAWARSTRPTMPTSPAGGQRYVKNSGALRFPSDRSRNNGEGRASQR